MEPAAPWTPGRSLPTPRSRGLPPPGARGPLGSEKIYNSSAPRRGLVTKTFFFGKHRVKYNYNLVLPLRRNKPVFCTAQGLLNQRRSHCFPSLQIHREVGREGRWRILTRFCPVRRGWEAPPQLECRETVVLSSTYTRVWIDPGPWGRHVSREPATVRLSARVGKLGVESLVLNV